MRTYLERKNPFFLRANQARDLLSEQYPVNRNKFEGASQHMLTLALPRRNRRYPVPYFRGLSEFLKADKPNQFCPAVEAFSRTPEAAVSIGESVRWLCQRLDEILYDTAPADAPDQHLAYKLNDFARVINFAPTSMEQWRGENGFSTYVSPTQGERYLRYVTYISETVANRCFNWQLPVAYSDASAFPGSTITDGKV